MTKDTYIRTRISDDLKSDFDAICATLQVIPSEQLRLMIEEFVANNNAPSASRFLMQVYRPEGYEYGVWRVTVSLRNPTDGLWLGTPIPFELPELHMRLVTSDPEYRAVVIPADIEKGPILGGRFDNGVWRGHIRSNGCEESMNPTTIESVQEALHATIENTLARFHGYASFVNEQKELSNQYQHTHTIANWIRDGLIWTKNPKTAGNGKRTPGIYGRNMVIGFCDSFNDSKLHVISRYLDTPQSHGTAGYHLYITQFEDWVTYMTPVNRPLSLRQDVQDDSNINRTGHINDRRHLQNPHISAEDSARDEALRTHFAGLRIEDLNPEQLDQLEKQTRIILERWE